MSTALSMQADGLRDNGRWKYGAVQNDGSVISGSAWKQRLKECGTVLDFQPSLADSVVAGARAMSTALVLEADGRREDGRWKRGSVANGPGSDTAWAKAVQRAGVVLDFTPDAAQQVVEGEVSEGASRTHRGSRAR